jgi:hypothetical protein
MSHSSFDQVHLPNRPPRRSLPPWRATRRSLHPARRTLNRLLTVAVVAVAGTGLHVMPSSAQSRPGAEATLQVVGSSSSSGPLLSDLAINQLAALVKLTPEQVVASVQPSLVLGSADVELNALLANPGATVGELVGLLTRAGLAPTTINEALDRLLSPVTDTVEQLSGTINKLLADLGEDGGLSKLAGELKLPAAVLETLQLAPTSVPELSKSLGTTAEQLRALTSATGTTDREFVKESAAATPLGPVLGSGSAGLLALPAGSGGVTLMTVSSTSTPAGAAAASPTPTSPSNAFSIVSIKVTRAGAIRETVRLPGPGRLAIAASATNRSRVRDKHGHARLRTRSGRVASVASQQKAGTHTITLHPRGRLTKARNFGLSIVTTFTPTGGVPKSIRRSLTVKHSAKKARARKR